MLETGENGGQLLMDFPYHDDAHCTFANVQPVLKNHDVFWVKEPTMTYFSTKRNIVHSNLIGIYNIDMKIINKQLSIMPYNIHDWITLYRETIIFGPIKFSKFNNILIRFKFLYLNSQNQNFNHR